jgi:HlyD family secretion protein
MPRAVHTEQVVAVGRSMPRLPVALLLLVTALLLGTQFVHYDGRPVQTYITVPIQRGNIATIIKATGSVNAIVTVDVSSQISGRIADVFVNFNDEVRAGQPIARVDPETYVARVNEAKAALKIAMAMVQVQQASLERASASLANARTARTAAEAKLSGLRARFAQTERELQGKFALARTAIVAEVELSRARTQRDADAADLRAAEEQIEIKAQEIAMAEADLRMAKANLRNAEAVVEQKQAGLEQAELDLQRTEIRAPIDGIIIKRDINPGQTVAVNLEAKTLFKIANDLREMEVYGKIDEADVGNLKVEQSVDFTVDAFPDRMFSGRVLQVRKSPEVVQNVVTYTAVISAPNSDRLLLPGMTANLRITVSETGDTLKIPNQSFTFRPKGESSGGEQGAAFGADGRIVWVLGTDGKPMPVQVTVGQSDDSATQLLSGALTEGQHVITGVANSRPQDGFFGFRLR